MNNGKSVDKKSALVTIDRALNKLTAKPLFKEKLDKANKLLKNAVFPKSIG